MKFRPQDFVALAVGASHRIAYASLLALVTWDLAVLPWDFQSGIPAVVAKVINLPVALAGQALPLSWRGLDLWFHHQELGYLPYTSSLWHHVRNATPVYLVLFYLPTAIRLLRGPSRRSVSKDTLVAEASAKV